MTPSTDLPVPRTDVVVQTLPDGAVLFSTGQEVYFDLNTVGARVWALLPPVSVTIDDVVAALSAEFPDVDRSSIAADVVGLLAELERMGLVVNPGAV